MESGQLSRSCLILRLTNHKLHFLFFRALPCPTLRRGSLPTQGRSCARSGMKQWLFVRREQVTTFQNQLRKVRKIHNCAFSFQEEERKSHPLHRCSCSTCIRIVTLTRVNVYCDSVDRQNIDCICVEIGFVYGSKTYNSEMFISGSI